ncbi:MAG: ATP-dependent protease ATPase subunit HslU [Planctomycetota bacterium]|nr:MAG: ATP-dependent protease ATPase subunit HslU [Planctomycetota bacterium]
MHQLTPREIVAELDRFIVGQEKAKRAVAIAVRNRWRRKQLDEDMRREVLPKNILMIGPTGVGKTEIARRLAALTDSPFVKVEATKYTEVGYVGRDVESMIRDLVENAIVLVRDREREKVLDEAKRRVEDRLVGILAGQEAAPAEGPSADPERRSRTYEKLREMLAEGIFDHRRVEVRIRQRSPRILFSGGGMEQINSDLQSMFEQLMPPKSKTVSLTVAEAKKLLLEEECDALINFEQVKSEAIQLAEESGIVFIDEIDKVTAREGAHGPDVSREGVQRDLLPIIEGTTVQTRHGHVKTDHILFIAAGAFHRSSPSDLMPELQGRFPIRVELDDLTREDFIRILKEPQNSLLKQYRALLETENVLIEFRDDAVEAIADYAYRVNQTTQNIGARRLYTILERLLEDICFDTPDCISGRIELDANYVNEKLADVAENEDVSRFIL